MPGGKRNPFTWDPCLPQQVLSGPLSPCALTAGQGTALSCPKRFRILYCLTGWTSLVFPTGFVRSHGSNLQFVGIFSPPSHSSGSGSLLCLTSIPPATRCVPAPRLTSWLCSLCHLGSLQLASHHFSQCRRLSHNHSLCPWVSLCDFAPIMG